MAKKRTVFLPDCTLSRNAANEKITIGFDSNGEEKSVDRMPKAFYAALRPCRLYSSPNFVLLAQHLSGLESHAWTRNVIRHNCRKTLRHLSRLFINGHHRKMAMNIARNMLIKYLSGLLTVGTTFVRSWFIEFTTTDKETDRRKLSVWGRRGIVFAGLASACSLGLTPWTNCEAAQKAYEGLVKVTWHTELSDAISDELGAEAAKRISNKPECADIPRSSDEPMVGGFPGGFFMISSTASVTYLITSDYVKFGFTDAGDSNSLGNGSYKFLFADGSLSNELQCTDFKTKMSCDDKTSDGGAKSVYADLQLKSVEAIKTDVKTYPVSDSIAKSIQTTFSCITP